MGRKKKEVFDNVEDALDDAIEAYLLGKPLTLEQTAVALWHIEGRKTKKPLTKMGVLKIEQGALAKMKQGMLKYGITQLDDVLDVRGRERAQNRFTDGIDEN